jgi:CRISPR-associated protein Csb1
VVVNGDIVRTTIVNLTSVRALGAPTDKEETDLRRYILGLTLIAALAPNDLFLRQGCLLVRSLQKPVETNVVFRDGRRAVCALSLEGVEPFASSAAEAFGVNPSRSVSFDAKAAKELLKQAAKVKEED